MEIFRKKNKEAIICFPMVTTATPETFASGETVTDTAYYSDAEGAFTSLAITDTVSEIGSTGMYEISLTAAEMNHDLIIIKFTSTNAADTAVIIRTRAVDLDDLVRATTPANTLDIDASGEVTVGTNNDKTGYTASTVTDKTGYSISGTKTTLDALNDISTANVNTEVSDVLKTDTITLPGQTAPPATPTFEQAVSWLYKIMRNKTDQTTTLWQLYDDAGTTVDSKATVSESAGTATKEEIVSGP